MPGIARAASVRAGRVWITSPREDVLTSSTRKLLHLNRIADQAIQRLDHRTRLQLAQAVVVAEAAGTLEAGAAIETETDDLHLLGQRGGELWRGRTVHRHQRPIERRRYVHQAGVVGHHRSRAR